MLMVSVSRIFRIILFLAACWLPFSPPALQAEAQDEAALRAQVVSWLGAWEFTEPRGGLRFIILRTGGGASLFSGDANTSEVFQGRWRFDGSRLEVRWSNGGMHVLERPEGDFRMSYIEAGADGYQFTVGTTRLPADHLGSWAVDPGARREERQQEDINRGFFGNWLVERGEEPSYFILIRNDRSAATNWTSQRADRVGRLGVWARQGTELHITWEDAAYTVLQPEGDGFAVVHFAAGEDLDGSRAESLTARRIRRDAVDSDWLHAFNAERDSVGWGIRFSNQRAAQRFYRGNWLVDRSDFGVERISLGRMGGIRSTRRPSSRGEWRLSTQDLFLNWEDGFRQVVTPVGQSFVLFEFAAGRPVDAVPSRVFQVIPEDLDKLTSAQREQKADHPVFDVEPVRASDNPSWLASLWPFGNGSRSEFPEDTYVRGDERSSNNPWWWPFWSETEAMDGTLASEDVSIPTVPAAASASRVLDREETAAAETSPRWLDIP